MSGTTSVSPAHGGVRRRLRSRYAVAALIVALAALFIAQNRDRLHIRLFWLSVSAPVWLLLTVMVLAGMAVGALVRSRR
jgi:lipopolysaccharide assembly protein A